VKGVSPNQMPVPMLERIIRLCSNPGDLIIDPFCGTGTAAVAAVRTGRRCIAFDLSAKCIDVAQVRVAQAVCAMTGQGPGSQQKLFADPQPGKEEVK
jgi:DNA modification methylase